LKTVILSILALIFCLVAVPAAAQDDSEAPNVEFLMTPEDFRASGLDKLSDAERAHLSEWLERYREGAFVGPEVNKPPSEWTEAEKSAERNFQIVAKVVPSFRGWSGKTTFRLDNGQVWQQRMPGRLSYSGGDSEVVVTKNLMGGYILEHVESGRSVLVKRVD
jgi:hypothetical protein